MLYEVSPPDMSDYGIVLGSYMFEIARGFLRKILFPVWRKGVGCD